MATLIKRLLYEVYDAFRAYGAMYIVGACPPPDERPGRLDGPPAAHPERLCPDVALTPVERALERELRAGS